MNVYTYILCILLISVSDYHKVSSRSTYDSSSYNSDSEQNQPEDSEHAVAMHESQSYRKYQPSDSSYSRRQERQDNRENTEFDNSKMNMQKREYYDVAASPKDASIEVILDPRAKKAVAVVENSPSGQAMYDLTSWKNNKDDNFAPAYESDQQFPQGNQEQVVNLVYPAEVNEHKYIPEAYEANVEYSPNKIMKPGYKEKILESKRAAEDTRKRKRNVEIAKRNTDSTKADSQNLQTKRISDSELNQEKSDSKQSKECPPHNEPSVEDNHNSNENKFDKQSAVKRETPTWSKEQISAITNSLAKFKDDNSEVQNLRNILSEMGLVDNPLLAKKRETAKENAKVEKSVTGNDENSEAEDEDLNEDNIILKRKDRQVREDEEMDVNNAPQEPMEKREAEDTDNLEEDNEEIVDASDSKNVKRSNEETSNTKNKNNESEDTQSNDTSGSRKKRQNIDSTQTKENLEQNNSLNVPKNEMNNINNSENKAKREIEHSNTEQDIRTNRDNNENDEEYERKMESQIQAKIDAIKEKVKREIMEEQSKQRYKQNKRKRQATKDETSNAIKEPQETPLVKNKIIATPADDPSKSLPTVVRRKRANTLPEKQMVYRPYQAEQDEEAEEDGEFDDNSYDGRMYLDKRQADEENDYYDPERKREVESYLRQYYPGQRSRRSFADRSSEDSSAFHGTASSNKRTALKNKNFIEREKRGDAEENSQQDNSKSNENDYFGSLPQSYNGELTRYKRVKRDNPYK